MTHPNGQADAVPEASVHYHHQAGGGLHAAGGRHGHPQEAAVPHGRLSTSPKQHYTLQAAS